MVRALPLEALEYLPGLVQGLPISLSEGGDVSPQLCSLTRREIFAEEGFGENLPCGEQVGLLVLQPVAGSVSQLEWEKPHANCINRYPIQLNSIILRNEVTKVHVGVLRRVPTELIFLHQRNQGWTECEICAR